MKKILSVILMAAALLLAGNVFAKDADAEAGAKVFAKAWSSLDVKKICAFEMLEVDISGFSFGKKDKTQSGDALEKALNGMDENKKKEFLKVFSLFASTMKVKASKDGNVVTVSKAKGDDKYIICLFNGVQKEENKYTINSVEMEFCQDDDELKMNLESMMDDYKELTE